MKYSVLSHLMIFALLASYSARSQETVQGERLSSSRIHPGVIESMADAAFRQQELLRSNRGVYRGRKPGEQGIWMVPERESVCFPSSGKINVINKWGDTRMGFRFPKLTHVHGAYFVAHRSPGVKALGFCNGKLVKQTQWLTRQGKKPRWLEMDFYGVDRVEIHSKPVFSGGGWYAMDDLTFTSLETSDAPKIVLDFEDLNFRTVLTGSQYKGLVWETGTGDFEVKTIHAPFTFLDKNQPRSQGSQTRINGKGNCVYAPSIKNAFQGVKLHDAGASWAPPDTDGAVGPDHFVETVNCNFAVYEKATGQELINMTLQAFLPGCAGDPRVLFDQHSQRWFMVVDDFVDTLYLAVSLTDDPMGSWFKTSFQVCNTGEFPDFPTLGVDENGIYISTLNQTTFEFHMAAIDKAPLIAPNPQVGAITIFKTPYNSHTAFQPAHTYGASGGAFLLGLKQGYDVITIYKITPPMSSPKLVKLPDVAVPYCAPPPEAPTKDNPIPLDPGSGKLEMAVFRDNALWTCHCVESNGRAACRWYEIDAASLAIKQMGTVSDPERSYFYPSIMVNKKGDALMGFTGSSEFEYASCYLTGRGASDPPGEMAEPILFKPGYGSYVILDGYGRNRWGDYSYTTLDPKDEETFWTIQEYIHANDDWGTYICRAKMEIPALAMALHVALPKEIPIGPGLPIIVDIKNAKENLVPGSGVLHYRYDGGAFKTSPLAPLGNDLYQGKLPMVLPKDKPEFYFSAQGDGGAQVFLPEYAPEILYHLDAPLEHVCFEDRFETDLNWIVDNTNATSGLWERGDPEGTYSSGIVIQPEDDHTPTGTQCFCTGLKAGANAFANEFNGGPASITSPLIGINSNDARMEAYFHSYYYKDALKLHVSGDQGLSWVELPLLPKHQWQKEEYKLSDYMTLTDSVKFRITVSDINHNMLLEAAVDDFKVTQKNNNPQFWADVYDLMASKSNQINLCLDANSPSYGGRNYLILGSVSGIYPGFSLPGGLAAPIRWDLVTDFILQHLNSPVFVNFAGALDGEGKAQAALKTFGPIDPSFVGMELTLLFLLAPPSAWDFVSNTISIKIES